MTIERKDTEKVTRVSATAFENNLLDTLDYLRYKELIADIDVTKDEVDKLATELNSRVIQNFRENNYYT